MKKYRSHGDARIKGELDVWPGCGALGRCMPCGRIAEFDEDEDGKPVKKWQCRTNRLSGCPKARPEPEHAWDERWQCHRCAALYEERRMLESFTQVQLDVFAAVGESEDGTAELASNETLTAKALQKRKLITISGRQITITEKGRKLFALYEEIAE